MNIHFITVLMLTFFLSACSDQTEQLNKDFGKPQIRDRIVQAEDPLAADYLNKVKPILENRCVVCHGCYDSPCQLKLSSVEGIDRGFSPELIYGLRLSETAPTRLFIDAENTQQWRDKEKPFKPVLNERDQTPIANLQGSVLYQMLAQKNAHPLPEGVAVLPDSFDFSLDREQQCPSIETMDQYQEDFPLAGMPYGFPNISKSEFKTIQTWVERGAPMAQPAAITDSLQQRINDWETLLNRAGNKAKLINRYLYEHLFLGHIYFDEEPLKEGELPVYFRLVRSSTPVGQPIKEIATRRPYDDPKVKTVYYRFRRDTGTVVSKTHMPYAFNQKRLEYWKALFYGDNFTVPFLPDYDQGSNPFVVFASIPVYIRHKFLLEEAQFTISSFIKGPVCRGQTALNVIRDKFWVFFTNPDLIKSEDYDNFIYNQSDNLELPSDFSAKNSIYKSWSKYAQLEKNFSQAQDRLIKNVTHAEDYLGLDRVWTGNDNAALTIYRHFDSAIVKKGLHGKTPQTAWIINYPTLERIHYLLVAGFDIYGTLKHQLITRLYMDFLRINGEVSFITLLPKEIRRAEIQSWYLNSSEEVMKYLTDINAIYGLPTVIKYETDQPKAELLEKLRKQHIDALADKNIPYTDLYVQSGELKGLNSLPNIAVQQLAQSSFIMVDKEQGDSELYTLLRNNQRANVSTLLAEAKTRQPERDSAELYKGLLNNYPDLIFYFKEQQQAEFVKRLKAVTDARSYALLLDDFAIRRTNPDFWAVSDKLHKLHLKADVIHYGLLDYNRLENR